MTGRQPGLAGALIRTFVQFRPYLILTLLFFAVLLASHYPYWNLPYFWDEAGQFIPAALDLLQIQAWIPSSTLPNIHPPGVMAYLAAVWGLSGGHTILATRVAMLFLAALGFTGSFALAVRLTQGAPGLPAFGAIAALMASPLVFTQSMMAQLDFPALTFTVWALVLFLHERHLWAAACCVALVLVKETGLLLPMVFAAWLIYKHRDVKDAVWYMLPLMALGAWITVLWMATGNPLGNQEFASYNTAYSLHPVRLIAALLRRIYYLFLAEFRWIGTVPLALAWRAGVFRTEEWKVAGGFAVLHVAAMSLLGGATLERYLLPAMPVMFAAMGVGWGRLPRIWKVAAPALMAAGMLVCLFTPPMLPAPFENNLAMVDVVELHEAAAQFVESTFPGARVATAWPLSDAMRRPEFGYVSREFDVTETHDFRTKNVLKVEPDRVDVIITWDRNRESTYSFLRGSGWIQEFLKRFYDFEPQISSAQIEKTFRMYSAARWDKRGQWIEIWIRPRGAR